MLTPTPNREAPIDVVMTAAGLVVFPVLAGILGALVAAVRTPAPSVVSGVQHFAAGVVMAAVAGEVLPQLRERGHIWQMVVGFAAAIALLLLMRRFEGGEHDEGGGGTGGLPIGFLVVMGVDLFIDGLLVGAGAAVSRNTAIIITIALTIEVLFLSLAIALRLRDSGASKVKSVAISAGLTLLIAVGAVLGALVLNGASDTVLGLVLAFAAAALLWLVVEELLVEAHEVEDRSWMTAMFFVGFIALFCLEAFE